MILVFLEARDDGYTREIARFFETDSFPIQEQLEKLENGSVIVRRKASRTVLYKFNPRYPLLKEFKLLLNKALLYYPEDQKERLLMNRRRPRRQGKPK
jgi:hypothetical protein